MAGVQGRPGDVNYEQTEDRCAIGPRIYFDRTSARPPAICAPLRDILSATVKLIAVISHYAYWNIRTFLARGDCREAADIHVADARIQLENDNENVTGGRGRANVAPDHLNDIRLFSFSLLFLCMVWETYTSRILWNEQKMNIIIDPNESRCRSAKANDTALLTWSSPLTTKTTTTAFCVNLFKFEK